MGISKAVVDYLTRDPPPDEPITFRGVEWNVNGTMKSCIFCDYAAKTKERELLFEDDLVVAFRPEKRAAKQHLLILPKRHVSTIGDLISGDTVVLDRMKTVAQELLKCEDASNFQLCFHVPPWNSVGEALLDACPLIIIPKPALVTYKVVRRICTWYISCPFGNFFSGGAGGGGHVLGVIARNAPDPPTYY